MESIYYYDSPLGILKIHCSNKAIHSLHYVSKKEENTNENNPFLSTCKKELDEYFAQKREKFDLPIEFLTGTAFQQSIWRALCTIPYGQTASYKDIAKKVGNEKAVRAVGGANNKNPLAIIVPCHRVIGSDKRLVGYATGLDKKIFLLELEGVKPPKGKWS